VKASPSGLHELRQDPLTGRWSIIAESRGAKPSRYAGRSAARKAISECPFCPGRESLTPPEVAALRPPGSAPDGPGWRIRVIPNRYPAVRGVRAAGEATRGPGRRLPAIGRHEIVIETPQHTARAESYTERQWAELLGLWRNRLLQSLEDPAVRQVQIFRNQGESAGASQPHPHTQLLGLPLGPEELLEDWAGARRHFRRTGRCPFCDEVRRAARGGARRIAQNQDFIALAPWAPRFRQEAWILPRRHQTGLEEATAPELIGLARLLRRLLRALLGADPGGPWNLTLYSASQGKLNPRDRRWAARAYHWRLAILPRTDPIGGFECGTRAVITTMGPERTAAALGGRSGGRGR